MNKIRVLIVEDHPLMQQALVKILWLHDIDAITSETGIGALSIVRHEPVDLVLLDVNLKGNLTGLDVLRAIRKSTTHSKLPVILLTAEDLTMQAVIDLDPDLILLKPVEPTQLIDFIDRLLSQSDQHAASV